MIFLMTIVYFLIVIGILVFVHEFGHFIMAKRAGVRVEKFSLGMGPKLFGYKKGDTEYVLSWFPIGGYVKMAGENPDEEPTGATDEFQSKTVWQRAKIAATGPLTNIMLAFLIMPLVFMVGTYMEGPAKVGSVEKGSPAERAGFRQGDIVEKVNGRTISSWTKALTLIAVNPESDVNIAIERAGEKQVLTLRPIIGTDLNIGISGLIPDMPPQIVKVRDGSPADKAGVKASDKVLAVNGTEIYNFDQFSPLINKSGGKPVRITIERDGKRNDITVTPVKEGEKYLIGVEIKPILKLVFKRFGFIESVKMGFQRVIDFVDLTFITIKKLFSFQLSIKTMGGPVMIAQLSGEAAREGLSKFLDHLAMISISLGILNLLPIPVLDGGLLLFLMIEAVRRKPVNRKVMEVAQAIGAALLLTLIAVVSFNDVMRFAIVKKFLSIIMAWMGLGNS